jgi:hypothetical protein
VGTLVERNVTLASEHFDDDIRIIDAFHLTPSRRRAKGRTPRLPRSRLSLTLEAAGLWD